MITSGLMSSNTPEWATPMAFFKELDKEFHFTLDPCSAHENAKCEKHYIKEDDTDIEEIVKGFNELSDYGKDRSHRCG